MNGQTGAKSRAGCLRILGIFGCIGILVAACVVVAAILLLQPSAIETRYSGAQDLAASRDFEQLFADLGSEGVESIVVPSRGAGGDVLIIKMDESNGFANLGGQGFDGVLNALAGRIVQGGYDIDYISLAYHGPDGALLFTMTTDQEAVAAYTAGEVSRREFMGDVVLDPEGLLDMIEDFDQELQP